MNFEQLVHPFIKELTNPPQEKLIKEGSVNKDAIREALKLGFPDITPRTMSRDKNYKKAGKLEFKDLPDALFAYPSVVPQKTFGDLIVDWFDHDHVNWREEYETFHAAACQTVQIFLRDQLYTEESCTYGKAQKVVNMTFKHIYCLSEGKKRGEFRAELDETQIVFSLMTFTFSYFSNKHTMSNFLKEDIDFNRRVDDVTQMILLHIKNN
jgi:hypothetical protein